MSNLLNRTDIEKALPANLKSSATDSLTTQLNNIAADPLAAEHMRENFITYANVLTEGKWSIETYMNAIQYATYKLMGYTNQEAYFRTFPQRHAKFVAEGIPSKDIAAYVSQFHKGKLVNAILEKALIPVHVMFVDVYHQAIRVQADLMMNANSEKVRSDAANSILTHLAKPKDSAPSVSININNNEEMNAMKQMLADLGTKQLELVSEGMSAKEIAAQKMLPPKIEEAEFTEVNQ